MKPVLQILGRLLTDTSFRSALVANKAQALDHYGYVLTAHQDAIVVNILTSVGNDALKPAFMEIPGVCPHWPCDEMKDTLWQVLGGMMVDEEFRASTISDWSGRLSRGGYLLTPHHQTIMRNIVASFRDGSLSKSTDAVAASCPHWPCNDDAMTA